MNEMSVLQYSPETGRFGEFGGRYVPETLIPALEELTTAYEEAAADPEYWAELEGLLHAYVGRPTPLYPAERLGETLGGVEVYLKREDLNHTRSEEHTSELQSRGHLVCRLLLEKKKKEMRR